MIVCVCNAIREDELREVARKGATCPLEAYAALGHEPRCGCCLDCAQEVLDEAQAAPAKRQLSRITIGYPQAA